MNCNGNEVLLDTGSPMTLGKGQTLEFMGRSVRCEESAMGYSFDTIKQQLGRDIDALLGMDTLGSLCMLVDCEAGEVVFSDEPMAPDNAVNFPLLVSPVGVMTEVDGKVVKLVVDSGAQLSYFDEQLLEGLEPTDVREDFYPGIGTFEVPVYDVMIDLDGIQLQAQCGAIPASVLMDISKINVGGVIGQDLFASHKVAFDFQQRNMYIFNN